MNRYSDSTHSNGQSKLPELQKELQIRSAAFPNSAQLHRREYPRPVNER